MKSSYIHWLMNQSDSVEDVGILSRWVQSEEDFEPVEFHDILERIMQADPFTFPGTIDIAQMKEIAVESFVDYATMLAEADSKIFIIDDETIDKERLDIAVRLERYEEAAKLRDKLNGNKDENKP